MSELINSADKSGVSCNNGLLSPVICIHRQLKYVCVGGQRERVQLCLGRVTGQMTGVAGATVSRTVFRSGDVQACPFVVPLCCTISKQSRK